MKVWGDAGFAVSKHLPQDGYQLQTDSNFRVEKPHGHKLNKAIKVISLISNKAYYYHKSLDMKPQEIQKHFCGTFAKNA